jgi:peptidoglycan/LPS O-acetylase OafA/YrhL
MSDQLTTNDKVMGFSALGAASLGLLKYLTILFETGVADSPWVFLVVFVVPFIVGTALLRSRPRAGAGVIALFGLGLAAVCAVGAVATVQNIGQGIPPYWPDLLVIFVGGPLALLAVVTAGRTLFRASVRSRHA